MRYVVVGTAGSGKSTLSNEMATLLACPHIELDGMYWGPNWQAVPPDHFERAVQGAIAADRWIVDGNYSAVREIVWARATHIVWLNYGRATILSRVLLRTVRRAVQGTELSGGNRESLAMAFLSTDSILLDAHRSFSKNRRRFAKLRDDPRFDHLHWMEITHAKHAVAFIESLGRPSR